jgi:nuclear cap-binding protein subunit 1
VLKAAYDVWKNDTQMLAVVVELLLKYHVIECASVANWVFMKEMTGEFTRYAIIDICMKHFLKA